MIIDVLVFRERKEPLALDHLFRSEEVPLKDHLYALRSPVRFVGMVSSVAVQDVRIQGELSTRLDLVCGRCLQAFQKAISKAFDLTYVPNEEMRFAEEKELTYDDLDVGFFSEFKIDLNSVIIEQIVLEIPMKPVCSPSCRGLCDQCGANLNLGSCNCVKTYTDPRWAGLAEIRDRLKK